MCLLSHTIYSDVSSSSEAAYAFEFNPVTGQLVTAGVQHVHFWTLKVRRERRFAPHPDHQQDDEHSKTARTVLVKKPGLFQVRARLTVA